MKAVVASLPSQRRPWNRAAGPRLKGRSFPNTSKYHEGQTRHHARAPAARNPVCTRLHLAGRRAGPGRASRVGCPAPRERASEVVRCLRALGVERWARGCITSPARRGERRLGRQPFQGVGRRSWGPRGLPPRRERGGLYTLPFHRRCHVGPRSPGHRSSSRAWEQLSRNYSASSKGLSGVELALGRPRVNDVNAPGRLKRTLNTARGSLLPR